jgi:hypothetical protein
VFLFVVYALMLLSVTSSAIHILELHVLDNFTGGYWYSHSRKN